MPGTDSTSSIDSKQDLVSTWQQQQQQQHLCLFDKEQHGKALL
jgi:hypothetical protein